MCFCEGRSSGFKFSDLCSIYGLGPVTGPCLLINISLGQHEDDTLIQQAAFFV